NGHVLTYLGSKSGKINVHRIWKNPLIFELGRDNKHIKEVQPHKTKSSLSFVAKPLTDYEIVEASDFINQIIRSLCSQNPSSLSRREKLEILRQKISDAQASLESGFNAALAYEKRLLTEAYCALLPIKFELGMEYPSEANADFKIYAGRKFKVRCAIHNLGSEHIAKPNVRLLVPDDWTSEFDLSSPRQTTNLCPSRQMEFIYNIRAPRISLFRPRMFPIIGELSFQHNGTQINICHSFEVQIADPFTVRQTIVEASPEELSAKIELENNFPGLRMENVSISPFLPANLSVKQNKKSITFTKKASFYIKYIRPKGEEFRTRSTWINIIANEHPVRIRTVPEVVLPLGTTTTTRGIWMNKCDDGLTEPKIIGDIACRQTVANPHSAARYMYFGVSDNIPLSGKTYVTVDYYDDQQGAFSLQYDSAADSESFDPAYKDAGKIIQMKGSGTWKQATFVIEDALFAGRQNGNSDFRLVVHDGDLVVAQIAVSKFPVTTDKGGADL
ncbi:MAG: hypothetical protein QME62_09010, partial [Armatimonadota bacterium]|nr:hypothetical protein [Armatimonadota bacterium]